MNSFTDFVNDRKAYAMKHNEEEGYFCLPPVFNGADIVLTDASRAYVIDSTYTVKVGAVRGVEAIAFDSATYDSHISLREISLLDAKKAFPDTPRVFLTVEDLEEKIAMSLESGNTYTTVERDGEPTVFSFTYDGEEALELIRIDGDGEMTFRENGDWVPVRNAEEHPTIFDRDMIDIEPSDVDTAVAVWDKHSRNEAGVKKADLLPFAALVQ